MDKHISGHEEEFSTALAIGEQLYDYYRRLPFYDDPDLNQWHEKLVALLANDFLPNAVRAEFNGVVRNFLLCLNYNHQQDKTVLVPTSKLFSKDISARKYLRQGLVEPS